MPNGGPDNCGTCGFNRENHGRWGHGAQDSYVGYCTIRQLPVLNPFYTYCVNQRSRSPIPDGPPYSASLISEHMRIPWHDGLEPRLGVAGRCLVCQEDFDDGIALDGDESLAFCRDGHYVQWWKTRHPGETLAWEHDFETAHARMQDALEAITRDADNGSDLDKLDDQ